MTSTLKAKTMDMSTDVRDTDQGAARVALRDGKQRLRTMAPPVSVGIGLLALWEIVVAVGDFPKFVLPAPSAILAEAFGNLQGLYLRNILVTVNEMALGFLAAIVFALVSGVFIVRSQVVRRTALPLMIASQAVPTIAVAPLLIIWLGFGMEPKIIVVALITYFPIVVNFVAGFDAIDPNVDRLMRSLGASKFAAFWRASLPLATPSIFTGLRTGAALCAVGAVVAEWVGSYQGLGQVMLGANNSLRTDVVFASIFWLSLLSLAFYGIVSLIERIVAPWAFGPVKFRK